MSEIACAEGQRLFGIDPTGYDHARPDYPSRIYGILRDRCGLLPGVRTFEIGPGTGIATRHLLRLGANPLVAVEADERLAAFLITTLGPNSDGLEVKAAAFEDVDLPSGWFDLGTAASVLHWPDFIMRDHKGEFGLNVVSKSTPQAKELRLRRGASRLSFRNRRQYYGTISKP